MARAGRNLFLVFVAVVGVGYLGDHEDSSGAASPPRPAAPAPAPAAKYVKPVPGPLTSGFGARWGTTHYGIDIGARMNTPIRAVTAGTVIEAGPARGFGLWVLLRHRDGTVTVYGHMNTIVRFAGAEVVAGEIIARVGMRGEATGPHLHFEVWPGGIRAKRINPRPWLVDRGIHYVAA